MNDPAALPRIKRITMDITSKCNLRCIMCPPRDNAASGYDMSVEVYEKIASQVFAHTEELTLSCAYEPLMSRSFEEIMRITGR
jgi:molybdenum cofactor biosynthesis enzyme MoaA